MHSRAAKIKKKTNDEKVKYTEYKDFKKCAVFSFEDSNTADEQYLQIRTAICLDLGLVVMGHIISPPGAVRTLSLSSLGYKCKRVNTI